MPFRISPDEFDALVERAVLDLPSPYLEHLRNSNVDVVVETRPSRQQLEDLGMKPYESLFGLYQGVSLPERSRYGEVLPDKITIFQEPMESWARSLEELERQIVTTVRHEVAHFFGFDEDEVHEMGLG